MNDTTLGISATDVTEAVRAASMLANVSISVWEGTRTDQNLLNDVKQRYGATGDVGRVTKYLLAGADAPLKAVHSTHYAVRSKHYEMTLPWVSNTQAIRQRGPRLLPTILFMDYVGEITKLRNIAVASLDSFLVEYPDLVIKARHNLGGMADVNYPDVDTIKKLFSIRFDFEPIPSSAQFGGLPPEALNALTTSLDKRHAVQVDNAVREMWTQTRERVEHLVTRLGVDDKGEPLAFKEATIDNVRGLLTLLPGWNVTGHPLVSEVVDDIKTMLDGVDAKSLRKDLGARADVAAKAKAVADKMSKYGL